MVKLGKFDIQGIDNEQRKSFSHIWIPLVINLIGFSFSCFGPGNSNRFAETTQMSPVKAVFVSLYNTFDMLFNDMTRWEVLVILIMLIPVSWKMAGKLQVRFEHPILFTLFAFLLVSSNMTPPIFATANIDGEKGSYSLDGDEINFHTYPSNDEQKITFSGYKLNIKNISSIIQAECGQNFTAHYYLAITQSGDAYMIIIKPGGMTSAVDNFSDSEAKLKINKLSYKDIISASMINLGDSIGTMVVDKVGSHFYLSDKDFEIK